MRRTIAWFLLWIFKLWLFKLPSGLNVRLFFIENKKSTLSTCLLRYTFLVLSLKITKKWKSWHSSRPAQLYTRKVLEIFVSYLFVISKENLSLALGSVTDETLWNQLRQKIISAPYSTWSYTEVQNSIN